MQKKYHKIAILSGGVSAERDVSISSAKGAYDALLRKGYDAHLVDPKDSSWPYNLMDLKPDAVLNMLHGNFGEDGVVQGLLENLRLPYSHSGVSSSAIAMDKAATKCLLAHHGLPVAHSIEGDRDYILENANKVPFPAVLKPVSEGSSIFIKILEKQSDLSDTTFPDKSQEYSRYMLEKFIPGREVTVSVLNGKALGVTEIITNETFYDYKAKYSTGGSYHVIPADLPNDIATKMMHMAEKAHDIIGCHTVSRTDFRYNETDSHGIIILEINTQPGMTPTSLLPEQAEYAGIGFDDLVEIITENASCLK